METPAPPGRGAGRGHGWPTGAHRCPSAPLAGDPVESRTAAAQRQRALLPPRVRKDAAGSPRGRRHAAAGQSAWGACSRPRAGRSAPLFPPRLGGAGGGAPQGRGRSQPRPSLRQSVTSRWRRRKWGWCASLPGNRRERDAGTWSRRQRSRSQGRRGPGGCGPEPDPRPERAQLAPREPQTRSPRAVSGQPRTPAALPSAPPRPARGPPGVPIPLGTPRRPPSARTGPR